MEFHRYKKASDYEVYDWIKKSIPELTNYQKQKIYDNEIVRFSKFEFYKRRKRVSNIWWRLSAVFFPITWILIFISLPINFILTGDWGYSFKTLEWFNIWKNNIGL